jgi:putative heme-binding domain-containing protein
MEVYVNGELVALSETWEYRFDVDVKAALRPGANALTVWCRNDGGPAGFWLELRLRALGRGLQRVSTDGAWRARTDEPADRAAPDVDGPGWTRPHSHGPIGTSPWGLPRPSPRGAPATGLPAEEIVLPPGFSAELLYSVPQAREGSWVSLAVDGQGRLYASDQIGYLFRLTPPASAAGPPLVERVDVDLGSAHGLLALEDVLYVVVNDVTDRWESGLYRLTDEDGDDRLDTVDLLRALDGDGEHGPHSVVLAPDGRSLFVVGGNQVDVPADLARVRAVVVREDDGLLPEEPDPNGLGPGTCVSGGWVARTDLDGETWELVAVGLRNAVDLAFGANGDAFTVDSDMEWDLGLPWYRPPRVLQVLSGADYGWRYGSGKWDADVPDSVPPVLDMGPGSPTGILHARTLAFPPRYRDTLLVGDWALGRIQAVHLEADGAGHRARIESFARGTPLPVCDLVRAADGSLVFVTGGRGLKSGVYRVAWDGADGSPPSPVDRADEGAEDTEDPRAARLALEAFHGRRDAAAVDAAWAQLGSADPVLRNAARAALESQDVAGWRARALAEDDLSTALVAWLALARRGTAAERAPLLARIVERIAWDELAVAERLVLLRVLDRALVELGAPTADETARLRAFLEPRFPSGTDRVDRALARLLARLGSPVLVARTLDLIEAARTREEAIHHGFLLRLVDVGWTPAHRVRYLTWLNGAATTFEGGASLQKYLLAARDTALERLTDAERAALGELAEPLDVAVAATGAQPAGEFVRAWRPRDLLPHLERVTPERDLASGARAYERATCLTCHRIDGRGGSEGPDLTGAGGRFGVRDLLDTILSPSTTVSDQYRDTEIWTRDDRLLVGTILGEDATSVTIRTRDPAPETHVVAKDAIDLRRPTPLSRMPEGLLDTLELEEILDLLAYVLYAP